MKRLVVIIAIIFFVIAGFAQQEVKSGKAARAERETKRIEKIKVLLDSKEYVFIATHALAMSGSNIFLNSTYDLTIKGDSAFAYLPYFGVAYTAEIGGRDAGIKFEEPVRDYSIELSKSQKLIKFEVKVPRDTYHQFLTVSDLGYATLLVTCNNRQAIHFYGTIEEIEKE